MPGLGCFDLDTYLSMVERSRKWQCPHSMRNVTIRELHVDTYATRLLEFLKVRSCPYPSATSPTAPHRHTWSFWQSEGLPHMLPWDSELPGCCKTQCH